MRQILKTIFILFCAGGSLFAKKIVTLNTEKVAVNVSIVNVWNTGYQATISIHNKTDHPLSDWKFEFNADNQILSSIWNAGVASHEGSHYIITAKAAPWNATIPANGNIDFGYVAQTTEHPSLDDCSFSANELPTVEIPPVVTEPSTPINSTTPPPLSDDPSHSPDTSNDLPIVPSSSMASNTYENSVWVEDWTHNLDTPTLMTRLPRGVNTINIFVGELALFNGKPIITGFCADTPGRPGGTGATPNTAALTDFIKQCKAQGVIVKLSLGGQGGTTFGNSWRCLTENNISLFAQTLVDFCKTTNADGIDFDEELENDDATAALAGKLAARFKDLAPELQSSYCVFGGCNQKGPWHSVNTAFLENSLTQKGVCSIDRVYVMCYYDGCNAQDNEKFMEYWEQWLSQKFGFTPAQLSAGVDPNDHQTLPSETDFKAWIHTAKNHGWSTAIWDQQGVMDYVDHDWGTIVHNLYL